MNGRRVGGSRWLRVATVVAIVATPSASRAQLVRGRVVRELDRIPVAGAVVMLADSADGTVARTLSDELGRYTLRAPAGGRYHLRTLRVGFMPATTSSFALAAGATAERDVIVGAIPLRLEAIRVTDRNSCVAATAFASGAATVALWSAARTALLASVITDEAHALDGTVALFERRLDPDDDAIRDQTVRLREIAGTRPFLAPPAATLARDGFALEDDRGTVYLAPDADVLLSDAFGAQHCFGIAARDSAGSIGLAFAPIAPRGDVVDVAGTLWIDRATEELRALDFHYTGVPSPVAAVDAGGRLDFARLPTGEWIVSRWRLRLPVVERLLDGNLVSWHVREIAESGGTLLELRAARSVVWRASAAAVSGYVTNADGRAPLTGAVVSLAGTDYTATTDALGTFVIPDVVPGRYRIELHWAPLDSMGVVSHARAELVVQGAGERVVHLEAPALDSGLALVCGRDAARSGEGLLRGVLRAASGAVAPAGTRVRVAWHHFGTNTRGDTVLAEGERSARSDAVGRFTVCGVPRDVPLAVRAPADAPTALEAMVPRQRPFAWLEVRVP